MEPTVLFQLAKGAVDSALKFLRWITSYREQERKRTSARDGEALLERFLLIFKTQSVPRPLIPRFAAAEQYLTIQQACSDSLLSEALTDNLVRHVAARFAIAPSWLYGVSTTRYDCRSNYKNPRGVIDELVRLLREAKDQSRMPWDELLFVSNGKVPEISDDAYDPSLRILILLRCQLDRVEGIDVERVHVIEDDLPWDHAPARFYVKQVVLLAMHLGIPVRGVTCSAREFAEFERGKLFPHELAFHRMVGWHPDDYVALAGKSVVAKQTEEAAAVHASVSKSEIEAADHARQALGRGELYSSITG